MEDLEKDLQSIAEGEIPEDPSRVGRITDEVMKRVEEEGNREEGGPASDTSHQRVSQADLAVGSHSEFVERLERRGIHVTPISAAEIQEVRERSGFKQHRDLVDHGVEHKSPRRKPRE